MEGRLPATYICTPELGESSGRTNRTRWTFEDSWQAIRRERGGLGEATPGEHMIGCMVSSLAVLLTGNVLLP